MFTIGKVARAAFVGVETIRFYEKRGLITRPELVNGKFRDYSPTVVPRIRFIKRSQELGFTLAEIQDLLRLTDSSETDRAEVKEMAKRKRDSIQEKVADLQRMKSALTHLINECSGHGPVQGCPIIEAIVGTDESCVNSGGAKDAGRIFDKHEMPELPE